ncbi:helix-turn-helix transcriptional regulator [uncultured Polaribacter sp.]|uniref:helix-turn-helix domain-containing protein n=1 Tax=uncultured Polaribacter sp. TaxID=174711 RepID=UPI00276561C0|nr:helix-turn-helix domain-containing protein [Polaribacter sp.]|tara:strand:- start:227 stop:472 length:246 start_codon:yes stop_codon:yes gene_type:complete
MRESINDQKVENQINHVLEQVVCRRRQLGFSQTDLAEKLGITLNGYYKFEKGKIKLDFRRMLEISEILNVEIHYFIKPSNA